MLQPSRLKSNLQNISISIMNKVELTSTSQ
jgi:hypothetical protein